MNPGPDRRCLIAELGETKPTYKQSYTTNRSVIFITTHAAVKH